MSTMTQFVLLSWTQERQYENDYCYLLVYKAMGEKYLYRITRWIYKPNTNLSDRTEDNWTLLVHPKSGMEAISNLTQRGITKLSWAKFIAQGIDYKAGR